MHWGRGAAVSGEPPTGRTQGSIRDIFPVGGWKWQGGVLPVILWCGPSVGGCGEEPPGGRQAVIGLPWKPPKPLKNACRGSDTDRALSVRCWSGCAAGRMAAGEVHRTGALASVTCPAFTALYNSVLFPKRLSTRSTTSRAVLLRMSSAGFSSTTSSERSRPVSAIISMHSCASR